MAAAHGAEDMATDLLDAPWLAAPPSRAGSRALLRARRRGTAAAAADTDEEAESAAEGASADAEAECGAEARRGDPREGWPQPCNCERWRPSPWTSLVGPMLRGFFAAGISAAEGGRRVSSCLTGRAACWGPGADPGAPVPLPGCVGALSFFDEEASQLCAAGARCCGGDGMDAWDAAPRRATHTGTLLVDLPSREASGGRLSVAGGPLADADATPVIVYIPLGISHGRPQALTIGSRTLFRAAVSSAAAGAYGGSPRIRWLLRTRALALSVPRRAVPLHAASPPRADPRRAGAPPGTGVAVWLLLEAPLWVVAAVCGLVAEPFGRPVHECGVWLDAGTRVVSRTGVRLPTRAELEALRASGRGFEASEMVREARGEGACEDY